MIQCDRCDRVLDVGDLAHHIELVRVIDEDEVEVEEMDDGSGEKWFCSSCLAHIFQIPEYCGVPDIFIDG